MSKRPDRKKKVHDSVAEAPQRDWLPGGLALLGVALTAILLTIAARQAELPFCGSGSDCDIVQSSRWSMLLGLPITVWGLFVYAALACGALFVGKRTSRWRSLIFFATIGFAVSIYLNVIAVTAINATCLYCIASLVLMTAIYALTWRAGGVADLNGWRTGSTFMAVIVVGTMHLHYAGFFDPADGPEDPFLSGLAQHLDARGAKFYGAFWCPHCQEQKLLFGASAKRLPYVECSPNGQRSTRATACLAADIRNYPTWIIDGRRLERTIPPAQLARLSGYAGSDTSSNE